MSIDYVVFAVAAACIALLSFIVGCLVQDSFGKTSKSGKREAKAPTTVHDNLAQP